MKNAETLKDTCDCCGDKDLGVLYSHLGTPVVFTCRRCEPLAFDAVAHDEIKEWLNGGPNPVKRHEVRF
jgi:hypothetical protein